MKTPLIFVAAIALLFVSCKKEQLFQSEKAIKKDLKGTWDLIPIPRYVTINTDSGTYQKERSEYWTFDDNKVYIVNNNGAGESGSSDYSIHTSWTKAEVELKGVSSPLTAEIYNGKWQIVKLDDDIMAIANDHDGSTGLTQLEFKKR